MIKKIRAFVREEEGQGMAEYGLILAGVAVVAVVAYNELGDRILAVVRNVVASL
ncbi:Flp family type IVb pilin [Guptibacillus algicola]|uniref:Flp family type IVb pilin n=1 Tax=Guptibacillus algicola TaxID=225844 RepID=UPI001CD1E255|nr:Flp family type IVb pilin [Alkalihalobacillus algicola]MCA0987529.1 Flp family type IVb pilin [Alkalihalobacillus algicola]